MSLRLVFSTEELRVHGVRYEGFPIILDEEMEPIEPATSFLLDTCIKNGRARSPNTWARYGQDLYDFFGFVRASTSLDWKRPPNIGEIGPIEAYRDWSASECGSAASTVNHRLRTIRRFYEWCVSKEILPATPFDYTTAHVLRGPKFLDHVDGSGKTVQTPEFMLKEVSAPIDVLSRGQIGHSLELLAQNETHRLLFRLMVNTGLRSDEARSFPESYVFNPRSRKDLRGSTIVRVKMNPRDMRLKGSKARAIDVPVTLMEDMYWWSVRERPKRVRSAAEGSGPSSLFVTEGGASFSESALIDVFRRLSKKAGYRVRPHLLRHTYATHTLQFLRLINWKGEPLLYLKRRLGHSSLNTTMKYLHLLDELDAETVFKYEKEIDELFGYTGAPQP